MFSKKGKRKIIVNHETYYWCVTVNHCWIEGGDPFRLQVFSDSNHLFTSSFDYEHKEWIPHSSGGHKLHLGDAPKITPSIVRAQIQDYLHRKNDVNLETGQPKSGLQ